MQSSDTQDTWCLTLRAIRFQKCFYLIKWMPCTYEVTGPCSLCQSLAATILFSASVIPSVLGISEHLLEIFLISATTHLWASSMLQHGSECLACVYVCMYVCIHTHVHSGMPWHMWRLKWTTCKGWFSPTMWPQSQDQSPVVSLGGHFIHWAILSTLFCFESWIIIYCTYCFLFFCFCLCGHLSCYKLLNC